MSAIPVPDSRLQKLVLGETFRRPCWHCEQPSLLLLPAMFPGVVTGVCQHCGLIQRRTVDPAAEATPETTAFYDGNASATDAWLHRRSLFDTGRLSGYLDLILEHCAAERIDSALDAGCAEGLFSHVLKARFPNTAVYGVDPDSHCIAFGRKHYPEVVLEHALVERYQPNQRFDLITDFGAIYRSVSPTKVLAKYAAMLTSRGTLVAHLSCSTESLGDANKAIAPDSPAGLWPAKNTHGIIRMIADPETFGQMLSRHFEQVDWVWRRMAPYRKKVPFFFARKPRRTALGPPPANPSRFQENSSFLLGYATQQSIAAVESFVALTDVKRVAIYGVCEEAALLELILGQVGVEVAYRVHPYAHRVPDQPPLSPPRFLNALCEDPPDALIIADHRNQDVYLQVVRELGLNTEHRVFVAFEKRGDDRAPFVEISGERFLHKAFRFSEHTDSTKEQR